MGDGAERAKPQLVRAPAIDDDLAIERDRMLPVSELLDRMEQQVEELARTKLRLDQVERALAAERETRQRLDQHLSEERARSEDLQNQVRLLQNDGYARRRLEEQLAQERAKTRELERQLEEGWREIHALRSEVTEPRRRWPHRRAES